MDSRDVYFSYPFYMEGWAKRIADQTTASGLSCCLCGEYDSHSNGAIASGMISQCKCFVYIFSDTPVNYNDSCLSELDTAMFNNRQILCIKIGQPFVDQFHAVKLAGRPVLVLSVILSPLEIVTATQQILNLASMASFGMNAMHFGNPASAYGMGYGNPYGYGMGYGNPYANAMSYGNAGSYGYSAPQVPADNGDADLKSGDKAMDKGQRKEAFDHYQKAADKGNAEGMAKLGYLYQHGWGTASNSGMAKKWYQKATDQGNLEAQAQLAFYMDEGKQRQMLKAAADKGCITAECMLTELDYKSNGPYWKNRRSILLKGVKANNPQALFFYARDLKDEFMNKASKSYIDKGILYEGNRCCNKAKELHNADAQWMCRYFSDLIIRYI